MMISTFSIGSRRYKYKLGKPFSSNGEKLMPFSCSALGIEQDFLVEDIPELILDLPNIAQNLKENKQQGTYIRLRIKDSEKKLIEKKAVAAGKTTSAYIRETALKA